MSATISQAHLHDLTSPLRRTCGALLLLAALAAAADFQQPNQAPSGATGELPALSAGGLLPRLPKINIFIGKNEIKKLLGIDSQINYVTNGNINTYPLTFTIPLGYNQSDIIFTWQNLGQTNVNYSISLVIGNMLAVEAPLINITRSGLIPRHEQVFKITLPCSGKITDEVDVQVLINVSGAVSEEPEPEAGLMGGLEPPSSTAASLADQMQQDEPRAARLVSHTLAIKRKKICTMQQIQVKERVAPLPASHHPPAPPPAPLPQATSTSAPSRWLQSLKDSQAPRGFSADPDPSSGPTGAPVALPVPTPALPPANELEENTRRLQSANLIPTPHRRNSLAQPTLHQPLDPPPLGPYQNWRNHLAGPQAQPDLSDMSSGRQATPTPVQAGNSPLVLTLVALSLVVSVALVAALVLSSAPSSSSALPVDKLRALTRCILRTRRAPAGSQLNKCKSPMAGAVIGSLRAGPKAGVSSLGTLAAATSGQSKAAYCFKSNCSAGYYAQQQYAPSNAHLQQQPPTADLLGTGYQCQQPQQQYPIYHIATGGHSQTTRLIWNNGNGTSPDGFTIDGGSYMPLSNAPRSSDSGSLYQTIY